MDEENVRVTLVFILEAIEKLSEAILTDSYEPNEIHEINQDAGIHLYDLIEKEGE